MRTIGSIFALLPTLVAAGIAWAYETDQFTVPPGPLVDLGPRVSARLAEELVSIPITQDPAKALYQRLGRGIPETDLELWLKKFWLRDPAIAYRVGRRGSTYRRVLSPVPYSFRYLAPTVNLYGFHLGTDKIGHFIQQGHEYYLEYMAAYSASLGDATACSLAVARGKYQEDHGYGIWISGIRSNADLAANFAGMKFYLNLLNEVRIGERALPPILVEGQGYWRLRDGLDPKLLLEPFVSDHLNESLNPNFFRFSTERIRDAIRVRCAKWKAFYGPKAALAVPAPSPWASKWHGQDYGYELDPRDEISIATVCP